MKEHWDQEAALRKLAEGEYNGYIYHAAAKLFTKLPLPRPDWEDLWQEFVIFAMEAIRRYDEYDPRGAAFTTTLYKHLEIRSLQAFNVAWMAKNHPKGQWVLPFSHFLSKANEGDDMTFDPTEVRPLETLNLQIKELKARLSPRSQQLFDYFTDYIRWEEQKGTHVLERSLLANNFVDQVVYCTGLQREEVETFVKEIRTRTVRVVEIP